MRTVEDLIAGIQARHDDLDAYAETAERLGKAPEGLVEIMRDLRVPLVKAPASIGGDELSMMDQVQYFEALAYSNPTAGWTGFNHAGAAGMCGARLNDAGIEEIFGSNPAPFFGAVSAPSGQFVSVDGGIKLTGTYRYASGATHAEWFLLTAIESSEQPAARLVAIRAQDVSLSEDWDVMALKGTGSVNVTADSLFVPDHLLADPFLPPERGGPMYTVGYQAFVAGENLGFSLGVCQRFLDEIVTYAATKSRGGDGRLADRGAFQYELGKSQLEVNAARAFGIKTLSEADAFCERSKGLTDAEETTVVSMLAFSTQSAVDAVSRLYHFAGAEALFSDHVLQRCFRDAHGSALHHVASNVAYDKFGKKLLNID